MTTVFVANRLSGNKSSREPIENVDLKISIHDFKQQCAIAYDSSTQDMELLYCGRCLKDNESLESSGIKPGCTVHILKKRHPEIQVQPEPMDQDAIQQVVAALQTALGNPAYRSIVEKMLTNPETLENLMAATPGLAQDPIAMAMLQDHELLALLADPAHIDKVIEAHPAIGHAAMHVAAAVNEEGASSQGSTTRTRSSRGIYSLDQMSDDDEMEGTSDGGRGTQPITASQLTAALAVAQGEASTSQSADTPMRGQSSAITTDFFRQALAQATGTGGSPMDMTPGSSRPSMPPHATAVTESQLAHMRDMGITDEAVARNALEATGGDIHAALELIFGDGNA